jgi:hypothetical protein
MTQADHVEVNAREEIRNRKSEVEEATAQLLSLAELIQTRGDECPVLHAIYRETLKDNILNERLYPLKEINIIKLKQQVRKINDSLKGIHLPTMNDLIIICKAIAKVITSEEQPRVVNKAKEGKCNEHKQHQPPWLTRLNKSMDELFRDTDRLRKFTKLKRCKQQRLVKQYGLTAFNLEEIIESCQQKLKALKARRKRYIEAMKRKQENKDFIFNRKKLFTKILRKDENVDPTPDKNECETSLEKHLGC